MHPVFLVRARSVVPAIHNLLFVPCLRCTTPLPTTHTTTCQRHLFSPTFPKHPTVCLEFSGTRIGQLCAIIFDALLRPALRTHSVVSASEHGILISSLTWRPLTLLVIRETENNYVFLSRLSWKVAISLRPPCAKPCEGKSLTTPLLPSPFLAFSSSFANDVNLSPNNPS